ncbi:MAG: DUF4348 domain-containing protein [Prevotella sp.]|nr:DUF4348 domain-containing protein [Prevotella sp.]
MKKWIAALLLMALTATGCTNSKTGTTSSEAPADTTMTTDTIASDSLDESEKLIAEEPMSAAVDELFDDFIFNFAANRKLQLERIRFPLLVNSGEEKEYIERKEWKHEHFFMRQDYYTLIFDKPEQIDLVKDTALTQAVVEKIFLSEHFVRQYIFNRENGRWMLTEIRNQTLPRNPNAQFLGFYEQFVTDSVFQRESLDDQIDFVGPDPDDDFAQMEGVITPDFWDAFCPELPTGMIFNIVYGQQNPATTQKVFIIRGIANGLEVELTFKLHNGRWKLTKMST